MCGVVYGHHGDASASGKPWQQPQRVCWFIYSAVTGLMSWVNMYFMFAHKCDMSGKNNLQESSFVSFWPGPYGHVPISLLVYSETLSL